MLRQVLISNRQATVVRLVIAFVDDRFWMAAFLQTDHEGVGRAIGRRTFVYRDGLDEFLEGLGCKAFVMAR